MSKHSTPGGNGAALLGLLVRLQVRAEQVTGGPVGIVVILFAMERRRSAVWPARFFGTVVRRDNHDRFAGDAESIEFA
jgi:hypothetical protein